MIGYALVGYILAFSSFGSLSVVAAEKSVESYLDSIRETLPPQEMPKGSFIDERRKAMGIRPEVGSQNGSHIDAIKEAEPEKFEPKAPPATSYLEQEKAKLEPKKDDSAIQRVKEGRSQLEMNRGGPIRHAAGFAVAATRSHDIKSTGTSLHTFDEVYGTSWAPDLTLFYNYQPLHSEWAGSLGFYASLEIGVYRGQGIFRKSLAKPWNTNENFSSKALTKYTFIMFPVSMGPIYRFNLARLFRPFAQVGPTLIGYMENTSEDNKGHRGYSTGVQFTGGVNVLLDWFSHDSTWNMYDSAGAKHYYLTLAYTRLTTFGGDLRFSVSGMNAGMTFEF